MGAAATQFATIKSAKDYLVGRIVAEAERQGAALSTVEREMLYFAQDGVISKHMEKVNEEFERDYDEDEYEHKIASLVRCLESDSTAEQQEMWDDAILKLCEGDHYLLVLSDGAAPPKPPVIPIPSGLRAWLPELKPKRKRPSGDRLKLVLAALVVFALVFGAMLLIGRQ